MKISLIICFITVSFLTSCGEKKNDFSKKNKRNYFEKIEEKEKEKEKPNNVTVKESLEVIQLVAPIMDIKVGSIFLNNLEYKLEDRSKHKNAQTRNRLLKATASFFTENSIKEDIPHVISETLINSNDLLIFENDKRFQEDITNFKQLYKIKSSKKEAQIKNIKAYIGNNENIIDNFSLSLDNKNKEEIIDNNFKHNRIISTKLFSKIDEYTKSKSEINLFIYDYEIIENNKTILFSKKVNELLKDHYRLVISNSNSTEFYYVHQDVSIKNAISQISNSQVIINQDGSILSLYGKNNNYINLEKDKLNLNSEFIKLINFERQSINETPIAGKTYSIVLFKLKEVQNFSPNIKVSTKTYKFNSLKDVYNFSVEKDKISLTQMSTVLKQKEFHTQTKENLVYFQSKAGMHLPSSCTYLTGKSVVKSNPINNLIFNLNSKLKLQNLNILSTSLPKLIKLINIDSNKIDFSIKPNNKNFFINTGLIEDVCSKLKMPKKHFYSDSNFKTKIILPKTIKAPRYEYILNVETIEKNVFF